MFSPEIAVGVATRRLGVRMSTVLSSRPGKTQAKVHYTRDDLEKAELAPEEVWTAMRQDYFTSDDVKTWFDGVRSQAQQALADM